jgi:hypothetical protein
MIDIIQVQKHMINVSTAITMHEGQEALTPIFQIPYWFVHT